MATLLDVLNSAKNGQHWETKVQEYIIEPVQSWFLALEPIYKQDYLLYCDKGFFRLSADDIKAGYEGLFNRSDWTPACGPPAWWQTYIDNKVLPFLKVGCKVPVVGGGGGFGP